MEKSLGSNEWSGKLLFLDKCDSLLPTKIQQNYLPKLKSPAFTSKRIRIQSLEMLSYKDSCNECHKRRVKGSVNEWSSKVTGEGKRERMHGNLVSTRVKVCKEKEMFSKY